MAISDANTTHPPLIPFQGYNKKKKEVGRKEIKNEKKKPNEGYTCEGVEYRRPLRVETIMDPLANPGLPWYIITRVCASQ